MNDIDDAPPPGAGPPGAPPPVRRRGRAAGAWGHHGSQFVAELATADAADELSVPEAEDPPAQAL